MDVSERRVIGAVLLLLGISCLAVGIYTGQIDTLIEMLKTALNTL